MSKTKRIKLYSYTELSKSAQLYALTEYIEVNPIDQFKGKRMIDIEQDILKEDQLFTEKGQIL